MNGLTFTPALADAIAALANPASEGRDEFHRVPNRAMRRQAARGYGQKKPKRSRTQRRRA